MLKEVGFAIAFFRKLWRVTREKTFAFWLQMFFIARSK